MAELDLQEIPYDQRTMWINLCRVADRQIGSTIALRRRACPEGGLMILVHDWPQYSV